MMSSYTTSKRIGILGGGQLARFLSLKAQEMGLQVRLLCQSQEEPAAQVTKDVILGKLDDAAVRENFLKDLDVITFESEFVDASQLGARQIPVHPSVENMNVIRDRKTQKDLLRKFSIPTATEISFETKEDLENNYASTRKAFVLKKRLFGYDGYGTIIVKRKEDLGSVPDDLSSKSWIAEEFCPFKAELAFSIARNTEGKFYVLPLVETKQTDSKCDWVKGPVSSKAVDPLIKKFKTMMKQTGYVGLLSVELFQTDKGELLVNELAPRVHNSAHYSIEALQVSQFEAHLRAILGWPLPSEPKVLDQGFAMANLIGTEKGKDSVQLDSALDGQLHWYNKTEVKPGRKMGHLTVLDSTAERALKKALSWRKKFCL